MYISVGDNQVVPRDDSCRFVGPHFPLVMIHILFIIRHAAMFHVENLRVADTQGCKVRNQFIGTYVQNRFIAERYTQSIHGFGMEDLVLGAHLFSP